MVQVSRPTTSDEIQELLAWALDKSATLDVRGRGTKLALVHEERATAVVDLSGLSGVIAYEPEELILQVKPATPLADIEQMLADKGQALAFEPPNLSALLGAKDSGSIGGVLSCNLAGPRRIKAGAARDHFLGAVAHSGRGEIFKTGGRVVKNVTGYDLCKVLAGSYGTLAIMSEVTLKVLPAAEVEKSVVLYGQQDDRAIAALCEVLGSPHEISGGAHVLAALTAKLSAGNLARAGAAVTIVRVEGPPTSVAHRCGKLRELLRAYGDCEELDTAQSRAVWRDIRDVTPLVGNPHSVWRISVAPSEGAKIGAIVAGLGGEHYFDWGGGLVWAAVPSGLESARRFRAAVQTVGGGHATLVRARMPHDAGIPVFHPATEAIAALNKRLKQAFDPKFVLNPGRIGPDM